MAKSNDTDLQKVLHLLRAALGDIDPKQPLHKLFAKAPQCGPFEWMLSILAMEIDLRVDIPQKLADDRKLTAESFAARIAALPKIDAPTYTLDCLALVAQALLSLEGDTSHTTDGTPKAPSARKQKKHTEASRPTRSNARHTMTSSETRRTRGTKGALSTRPSSTATAPGAKKTSKARSPRAR